MSRTVHFRKSGNNTRRKPRTVEASALLPDVGRSSDEKFENVKLGDEIDERMGFARYESGPRKVGWLVNMQSTVLYDETASGGARAGVDYYFLDGEGGSFKATYIYEPYFLIACKMGTEAEVEEWVRRKWEGLIRRTSRLTKEDLSMPNHLLGYRRPLIKLSFDNVQDLLAVRRDLMPIVEKNKKSLDAMDAYMEVAAAANKSSGFDYFDDSNDYRKTTVLAPEDCITDIREYDVPYHVRVSIDKDIRVGKWYWVEAKHGVINLSCIEDRLTRADPVVLAWDIETTKLPLKFPDAVIDQIMMISYMIDGQGFLITNREIVSQDIEDFEYTPKPEYPGEFYIFNEPNEKALLERFFEHIKEARPTVMVTYNGDFFDWPFVEARASFLGIDMYREIGFKKDPEDLYKSSYCVHMDAFSWVKRDSYLPQGSQGLKAVTTAKLGYDPDELDPELMTRYASEKPQTLAEYSVSDAVATYYLYMKYVHPFIFSLCTIIPLNPDDVLRKGTGTLCEMLLMVQAYQKEIVLPNKHKPPPESFYEGHLIESETYVGGHVESIEAGVFRSDIPTNFALDAKAFDELINDLDAALQFSIIVEGGKKLEDVTNYDEVKEKIAAALKLLRDTPHRNENPSIYHLDVASMYPNIMTTNRLQPDSMIKESDCAACDFNRPGKNCDRRLPWAWRGEYLPAKRDEYNMIRRALENETFPGRYPKSPHRTWEDLSVEEQASHIKKRLQDYSKKIYHKIHDSKTIIKEAIICQRENPFYVDTVKNFRDRRYDYKGKQKVWKIKTDELISAAAPAAEIDEAKKMIVLFDSLQLAHKVILNSFYGYVMRKGSRWYSMEMAGVTCLTGAHIIQMAKELVERIGRPLELDTDGIWCMLPGTFPENFAFTLKNGKKFPISYPCVMLNHLVHAKFTNDQYQELVDPKTHRYETHKENTIFFEVDGPYRAMILPTSKEEDKNLKKRYAVFNHDGSLAELKGFELKRRGELKLIKIFQKQIFRFFLDGTTLTECYAAVAKIANRWLDVLYQHGSTLADEELIDLISENRSMSKSLEEYGSQKSTSITTARRLAEFLGEQMVKDKGLNCKYIISAKPRGAPVTERAVPVAIFSAEDSIKRHFLKKWLKEEPSDMDPRALIDWDYYLERLGSVIQKLITIPAALQKCRNPVPRIAHPDWLQRRINIKDDKFKQRKLTDHFTAAPAEAPRDIEDCGSSQLTPKIASMAVATKITGKRKDPPGAPAPIDPYASLPSVMPDPSVDYKGWLKYQKQKWKIQKTARERRRQLFGERRDGRDDGLGNFFRNQAEVLFSSTWQVLQLKETEIPGIVRAWVLMGRKIIDLKIKVKRELFMNLKGAELPDVEIQGCYAEKVYHTLPNGHPSVHLFKLTMDEEIYVTKSKELSALFCHSSVEAVYETQVSLLSRALLHLGASCSFNTSQQGALGKGIEQGFELNLLARADSSSSYLSNCPIGYTYLYHIVSGERQIFSVFSTTSEEVHVFILNAGKDAQPLPNLGRLYGEQFTKKMEENNGEQWQQQFEYPASLKFSTVNLNTFKKVQKAITTHLRNQKEAESKAMMFVVQSPQHRALLEKLPVLQEFPVITLQANASDSLPTLGWQSFVAKRIVSHILTLGSWIQHLLQLSRYGDIPICNLERDDPQFLIDIAYARRLQANNVVLWWSKNPNPDHGGYENDDTMSRLDTVDPPHLNCSGSYSSVCVEIDIRNLAINTILTSSLINELEGTDNVLAAPTAPTDGDINGATHTMIAADNTFSSASIAVLREMVKSWWAEACRGSHMADIMVQHLVRWIKSPTSFLYDRFLHYYVDMMSKKAFLQLLSDFRRVGTNVVFANSSRLILQTSKMDVGNAYAFIHYIVSTFKTKPLFHFLEMDVKEYWDYLVWYDDVNYGGKACQEVVDSREQTYKIVMHWQLSRFLPDELRNIFKQYVVDFIDLMHKRKHAGRQLEGDDGEPRPTQVPNEFFKNLTSTQADEAPEEAILQKSFTKPLKKLVHALVKRQRDSQMHSSTPWEFDSPSLPGSYRKITNPVLQFVKSLTLVLSLPKEINLEARILRKDLLAVFDLREFSKEGMFENPSESYKFSQVICHSCTTPRDLDLCRDEDLLPAPNSDGQLVPKPWLCLTCGSEFDKVALEERIVGDIYGLILKYNEQDLKCVKCKKLKQNEFADHCGCSGEWVCTVPASEVLGRLKVIRSLAEEHQLKMVLGVLEELGEWMGSGWGVGGD